MNNRLMTRIEQIHNKIQFSGTVLVEQGEEILAEASYGYANRAEQLNNQSGTRYGIASGCKIFTAIAICQLVEEGKISLDTHLKECLDIDFPNFNTNITIHHLLTHTSGIPDYFDEEVMDDFEELWVERPMYHIRRLQDFLSLFQQGQMTFAPGDHFHYNNAGYILLGLIVEQVSGLVFTNYVETRIFKQAGMMDSGYFALDSLPGQTAIGFIDREDGTWRTNIYSLPVQGGSDGGAFVTARDMVKLWKALTNQELLNEALTTQLLTPHVQDGDDDFYGYGMWIGKKNGGIFKYHVMGYDPGVSFHSGYYPSSDITLVVCANISSGAFDVMDEIEDELGN
ncbi:serine hydrolase domain-containing protein [Paenibacillus glacialis]|uniref:Penicillin-binding protein n=1 Tax=Paenibacillus glacialis TaxID=494026 RepID=A0A168L3G7_9BACL|nr:serine hydrolase [Paenibacillus glacialis]OAB42839.1 penicillin-binding protein [Paenibacillus glacialis]